MCIFMVLHMYHPSIQVVDTGESEPKKKKSHVLQTNKIIEKVLGEGQQMTVLLVEGCSGDHVTHPPPPKKKSYSALFFCLLRQGFSV